MEKFKSLIYRLRVVLVMIAFIAFVAIIGVMQLSKRDKVKVTLVVAPPIATVKVDGKAVGGKEVYVSPGQHSFQATYPGFDRLEKRVTVDSAQQVGLALTPNNQKARDIVEKYGLDYLRTEELGSEEANNAGEAFLKENPLTGRLPYRSLFFDIDYRLASDDENRAVIQIKAGAPAGRGFALAQIRDWGHDLTDYQIEFINFINPLVEGQ